MSNLSFRSLRSAHVPARVIAGAFILHSGLDKWKGDEATAAAVHGMASGTYPFLAKLGPERFLKVLAAGEIAVGAAVAIPVVPEWVAGAALTGFSGALLGLYARTPGLRKPHSIWPTQQGIPISKDAWLFGIGLTLLAESFSSDATSHD
jgi:uncharacterized membrane protein YphA (DoxX/SURF4 family)